MESGQIPSGDEVQLALGDKVVDAIRQAVAKARQDLTRWREQAPEEIATTTERTLANRIHDRLWDHIVAELDGVDGVRFRDKEPRREISIGSKFRIRVKRHDSEGRTSSYPTQEALDFYVQPRAMLPGFEELHLTVGYRWDKVLREVGNPTISLPRAHSERPYWVVDLPEADPGVTQPLHPASGPGPVAPSVGMPSVDQRQRDKEGRDGT